MTNSFVKLGLFFSLIFGVTFQVQAQSNSKGKSSPIVVGTLTEYNESENTLSVQREDDKRIVYLVDSTTVTYVGIPDKSKHQFTVGYGVKASVNQNNVLTKILLTPPIPSTRSPLKDGREMLSINDIFKTTDENADGGVSYPEFSSKLYYSPKHGPDKFNKYDRDKSGHLESNEFPSALSEVAWWKYSRKSAKDWFSKADKNQDDSLDPMEFKEVCNGKSHYENHFKRVDQDKSRSLSLTEFEKYYNKIVNP